MAKEDLKLLDNIRKALLSKDQRSLFVDSSDSELIEACIGYLKHLGYKIVEKPNYNFNVNDLKSLVSYFYSLLDNSFKQESAPSSYRNFGRDLRIAKEFVKSRKIASGFNDELAIKECAQIIKVFFDHIDEFHLTVPVKFELFGQAKMGWITEKAVQILQGTSMEVDNTISEKEQKLIADKLSKEYSCGYDLDSILAHMEV